MSDLNLDKKKEFKFEGPNFKRISEKINYAFFINFNTFRLDFNHDGYPIKIDMKFRNRIFNLGYYTWVEQQGVHIDDFEIRRRSTFWDELHKMAPIWDELIERFNRDVAIRI